MKKMLTKMKLVSITCEQSVSQRVLRVLKQGGALSARVSMAHVEEFDGTPAVDLLESQVKIECVVAPTLVEGVVDALAGALLPRFDVGFFVSEVEVLRPEIFSRKL